MEEKFTKIERLKKTIDRVAYGSLILDICIAIVTSLSILGIGNTELILMPINYMLTIVVVLSIGLFVTLIVLKHEENIFDRLLMRKYNYQYNSKLRSLLNNRRLNSLLKKVKIKRI